MSPNILKAEQTGKGCIAVLFRSEEDASHPLLSSLSSVIRKKINDKDQSTVYGYTEDGIIAALILKDTADKELYELMEEARCRGGHVNKKVNAEKCTMLTVMRIGNSVSKEELLCFTEGIALNNYQFNKYKKEPKINSLSTIYVLDDEISQADLQELKSVTDSNYLARDLGNEPVNYLNSVQLGEKITSLASTYHFSATVLDKTKITELKMGGLLGVNYGSTVPPTFSILEYKPEHAKNKRPFIFVGKGVTYDTGGYSLKPAQSMATMKSDMSGAAAVIGSICAIAHNNLPIHVVGLIPSTDNRINSEALVPDDIITMSDGTTVEVLNTDAEGRLILADALHYAKQYDPTLVIDLATLTGASAVITGPLGSSLMGTDSSYRDTLIKAGNFTFERLAEIPYWKEYADMLKSDVADLKNIGVGFGGSATAGKFLEHFTDYPWLHLDIAGAAFLKDDEAYKRKGSAGLGVRLLYAFAKMVAQD